MPEKTTARRARTVERRIQHLSVQFFSEELGVDGRRQQVVRTAVRGDLISLPLTEAARLDALGSLAPEGATVADVEADIAAAYSVYQASRRGVPADV